MYRYIVNRVLLAIPTLIGAAALVFVLMRLIPGDICVVRLGSGGGNVDPRAVADLPRRARPRPPGDPAVRRLRVGLLRLDFGISMWSGKPVAEEIAARLPISLEIAVLATVVAILIAIPLGTISALKQNSWIDHVVRTVAIAGIATPSFWLGIVSILIVLDVSQCGVRRAMDAADRLCAVLGRTRCAICRWRSCRRSPSATATRPSPCG